MRAARQAPVTFMAFDVLAVDAIDLCGLPWAKRRGTLVELHNRAPLDDIWWVNTASLTAPVCLPPPPVWHTATVRESSSKDLCSWFF
jgi:hypothetical protein